MTTPSLVMDEMLRVGTEAMARGMGTPGRGPIAHPETAREIYLAMHEASNPTGSDELVTSVIAAMQSHEVVGVAFPDSCCSIYRVQIARTQTAIGGDHATAEDAQALCDDLNARAAINAMQLATPDRVEVLERLLERAIGLIEDAEKDTNWCGGDPYGDSASEQLRAELAALSASATEKD